MKTWDNVIKAVGDVDTAMCIAYTDGVRIPDDIIREWMRDLGVDDKTAEKEIKGYNEEWNHGG